MIVCPNTSPLIVLARLDRLDLLGDASAVRVTRTVLAEIHDKRDDVATRIDEWLHKGAQIVDPPNFDGSIDHAHALGPGERSVLRFALMANERVLCLLDDAAARMEARRLGVAFTGTLGVVLRAKRQGRLSHANTLLRDAVEAGLYLDDTVLRRALLEFGEPWPPE